MKAVVCTAYGSAEIQDIPIPVPKDHEILVKVHYSSLNAADWRMWKGDPGIVRLGLGGLMKPRKNLVLGIDFSGQVTSVGRKVTRFQVDDRVFGELSNGLRLGAFAEFLCIAETGTVHQMSPSMGFDVAATLPIACVTALHCVQAARLEAGMKVLINGAAGGVGTFLVQLAKSAGAEVTAVCSTEKVDAVKSLGADHVLDYKKEDYTTKTEAFDVLLDIAVYRPLSERLKALKPKGSYFYVGGSTSELFKLMLGQQFWSQKSVSNVMSVTTVQDLKQVAELVEQKKVRPLLGKSFTLNEAVEGLHFIEQGNALGKSLVKIE